MSVLKQSIISPLLLLRFRFDAVASSARKAFSLAPTMKNAADLANYWTSILRDEEKAVQNTRPWKRLEFVPIHDQKKLVRSVKGECLHKDYAFGKSVDLATIQQFDSIYFDMFNVKTLVTLRYPFGPSTQPRGIELNKWEEAFEQATVHLLGSNHFDPKLLRVEKLIAAAQPDIVMVELDQSRMDVFLTDEELKEKIKFFNKCIEKLAELEDCVDWGKMEEMRSQLTMLQKYYHEMRNNEFQAALVACRKVPGRAGLILGDKKLSTQAVEMTWALERREEQWKKETGEVAGSHEQMMKIVEEAGLTSDFNRIILGERDRHMASVLHTLLHRLTIEKLWASQSMGVDFEPVSAVAVVGGAHVKGMVEIWAKPEEVYGVEND